MRDGPSLVAGIAADAWSLGEIRYNLKSEIGNP
jgi:hypothetical protein